MNAGTIFTGLGGSDLGLQQAGVCPVWGIEISPGVAEVAKWNMPAQHKMVVADVRHVNPADLPPVDFLHASPPCPSFSLAKRGGAETELDVALADAICKFIDHHRPHFFTLENVPAYRRSQSFQHICQTLHQCGFAFVADVLDAASYGIPQNRNRLFLRARRDGEMIPSLSPAPRQIGWYEAIAPLLSTLPKSGLAPWQELRWERRQQSGMHLVGGGNSQKEAVTGRPRPAHLPAFTVTASSGDWRIGDGKTFWRVTPRALAALMTFPDSYTLPPTSKRAARGLGNAVPPSMMRQIASSLWYLDTEMP